MTASFDDARYISLETFRRNGTGVRTAVWFANAAAPGAPPVLYVYTGADSGKVKRIRRNGAARIAICDARGKVSGPWHDARATLVSGETFASGMRLLNRKYWPWKRIMDVLVRLRPRHARAMIALTEIQFP